MFRLPVRCAYSVFLIIASAAPICAEVPIPRASSVSSAPDLFGTIALPVATTALDAKWRHARFGGRGPSTRTAQPRLSDLASVQQAINRRLSFRTDPPQVNGGDSWSTAANTLARGSGDCEDYAIAKGQSLVALGFPARDLFLVIGNDLTLRSAHAILVVRLGGRYWVLDSLAGQVVEAEQFRNFSPVITFSGDRKWVHGYDRSKRPRVEYAAARTPDLGTDRLSAIKVAQTAVPKPRPPRL